MERSKAKADKFRFIDEEKREKVIFSLKCIFSCAVGWDILCNNNKL